MTVLHCEIHALPDLIHPVNKQQFLFLRELPAD